MGIGTDAIKNLAAALAGSPNALAELDAAQDQLALTRVAYLSGEHEARQKFAESKPAEFAPVRDAEVAKKLADLNKPKVEGIAAAVAEVAER